MLKKILIVDDNKSWLVFHRELIQEFFGELFEVSTASSAAEAINLVRHNVDNPFDIILTDLQMEDNYEPLLAGEWLIKQIKSVKSYDRVPVVIISAMYNIEHIANQYNVECISKTILVHNKLIFKFMFEKLMPYLNKI